MVRLLKPLRHYYEKYGAYTYGLNKLYLLMEKQHNRGQAVSNSMWSPEVNTSIVSVPLVLVQSRRFSTR